MMISICMKELRHSIFKENITYLVNRVKSVVESNAMLVSHELKCQLLMSMLLNVFYIFPYSVTHTKEEYAAYSSLKNSHFSTQLSILRQTIYQLVNESNNIWIRIDLSKLYMKLVNINTRLMVENTEYKKT